MILSKTKLGIKKLKLFIILAVFFFCVAPVKIVGFAEEEKYYTILLKIIMIIIMHCNY